MEKRRSPEQQLDREDRYKIATACALLDGLSIIGQELVDNPYDFKPSSMLQIIFNMSELARRGPAHIVEYLQFTHETTKLTVPSTIYGHVHQPAGASEAKTIGESLKIVDSDMNPTAHFVAAANMMSGDELWLRIYDANEMQRHTQIGQEIVDYHRSHLLPLRNDGHYVLEWLKGIVRDADFYISQYDYVRGK